jgi:hypothetical protein
MLLVSEARRIISYQKLTDDVMPPKEIWHSAKKCGEWIEARYKDRSEGKNTSGGKIDINFEDWETE